MGLFTDTLLKKQAELEAQLAEPAPGPDADLQQMTDYCKRKAAVEYRIRSLGLTTMRILRALPPIARYNYYTEIASEQQERAYDVNQFFEDLKNDGKPAVLLSGSTLGTSAKDNLEKLEAIMRQNGLDPDKEAQALEQPYLPDDPQAPDSLRAVQGHAEDLEKLEKGIAADDPQAEEKKALLARARNIMRSPRDDYLQYVGRIYTGIHVGDPPESLELQMETKKETLLYRHIQEQTPQQLPFKSKLPVTGWQTPRYDGNAMTLKAKLTKEDERNMRSLSSPFSADMKRRITELMEIMGQIDQGSFHQSEACIPHIDPQGQSRKSFYSEQGDKYYGLIPLVQAKVTLGEALEKGNWDEIRKACQRCEEIRQKTDRMMDLAAPGWAPLFSSNLESTRPKQHAVNLMPVEYPARFMEHSRVNSMQLVYGFLQNTGVSVQQLLDDPVNAIADAGKRHVAREGLGAEVPLGAMLFRALSDNMARNFETQWKNNNNLLNRAGAALVGMAGSQEESNRIQTALLTGESLALYGVKQEAHAWEKMAGMDAAKRKALYTLAALLPEKSLDLKVLAKTFSGSNWKQVTDPAALLKYLRLRGELDLNVLAQRTKTVLEQAQAEKERRGVAVDSAFDPDEYMTQVARVYREVLASATPEERESPGYAALQNSLHPLRNQAWKKRMEDNPELDQAMNNLDSAIKTVKKKKQGGVFRSSKDSDEHQKMTNSLKRVQMKLKQLRNNQGDKAALVLYSDADKQRLQRMDLKAELRRAREAAYEYSRIKSKGGTKTTFSDQIGEDRYNGALDAIDALDTLGDELRLTSPADTLLNRTQLELLDKRSDPEWMEENAEDYAARMIYGMHLSFQDLSWNEENQKTSDYHMQQGVEQIKQDPAFRRMVEKEGLENLADKIIQGKGGLTDAYVKASNALKEPQERIKPKTVEEKAEVWKQYQLPG